MREKEREREREGERVSERWKDREREKKSWKYKERKLEKKRERKEIVENIMRVYSNDGMLSERKRIIRREQKSAQNLAEKHILAFLSLNSFPISLFSCTPSLYIYTSERQYL